MRNYTQIPFNKDEIKQELLDIVEKKRSNLFTWNGQFSPQFVEVMLKKYCSKDDVIYDPFLGSGTVLYEAGLNDFEAYGTEINPSAFYISRSYHMINIDKKIRISCLETLGELLKEEINDISLEAKEIQDRLGSLLNDLTDLNKTIFRSFVALLDFENKKLDHKILFKKWEIYKTTITDLPFSSKKIKAYNSDARNTPLLDNSVDFVITSPPYINVFNYHQQYRKSMEFLGYEVLEYAKSEIGSNRKHRSNRFLTVIQYCLDISMVLAELTRVCKNDARIIFVVVRESNIKKTPFNNSEIIYLLGVQCLGLDLELKQERVFKNKYGQMIYEDILHFKNTGSFCLNEEVLIANSRNIAKQTLEKSLQYATEEVRDEISAAIEKIELVMPSPLI